jgi:hypothetical protein
MKEMDRLPWDLEQMFSGDAFRRKRRFVLPLLTTDAEGYPRVALLTAGEVRANSARQLVVAVHAASRTAVNLIRRRRATLLFLHRSVAASIQARAGRGRVSSRDPDRHLFPLAVHRVRLDSPDPSEGDTRLQSGPTFTAAQAGWLFSAELFEELSKVRP